ncbi:hypothetical protein FALBO_7575 [Fusarium albosuccineum]|uniref:Uncharacterized protein n=1 Tax=Fusarium albosuccineum TaxID=1237068 RepID=A0A8H4L9Y6_9HYPO|nr:hypothetical protein FALBO_7575 [Fusarium albosuccineum]
MSRHHPLEYRCLATKGPRSFLFYIVANVGPDGAQRPLSVALRQGVDVRSGSKHRVKRVLGDIVRLLHVLSEPANRIAIEAERALAAAWYRSSDYVALPLQRPEVPDAVQPPWYIKDDSPFLGPRAELPWSHDICEFPFISTCILLGLTSDPVYSTRAHDVQFQPLATVFRDDRREYGMVVLDISDLDDIGYGIVAFPIHYMAEVQPDPWRGYDPIEDPPAQEPDIVLTQNRPRIPRSAGQYAYKLWYGGHQTVLKELYKFRLVDVNTFDYIWPLHNSAHDNSTRSSVSASTSLPQDHRESYAYTEAISSFINQEKYNHDYYHNLTFPAAGRDVSFNSVALHKSAGLAVIMIQLLRRQLDGTLGNPSWSTALGQLLSLAYSGRSILHWVAFQNLTYEAIATAIKSDELKSASALSLCIDNISGDPNILFATLSRSENLVQANWLQNRKITLACTFSAPLREMPWLPKYEQSKTNLPSHIFPVTHMLIRRQLDVSDNPKFQPDCHFIGDALLDAERFAAGFLSYIHSIQTDKYLLSFALGPPTLDAYASKPTCLAVSPIPAESFIMARKGGHRAALNDGEGTGQSNRGSHIRGLEPGSWVVLVTVERYLNPEAARREKKYPWGYPTEAIFSRYAFIKAPHRILAEHLQGHGDMSPQLLDALVRPASLDVVGGLHEFLLQTAPHIDTALVQRLLDETEKDLGKRNQPSLAPGMSQLSVLNDNDARSVFRAFLTDSMETR